jgi:hypothetical protein
MSPGKGLHFVLARCIKLTEVHIEKSNILNAAWGKVYLHIDGNGHRLNKTLTIQEARFTVQAWAQSKALQQAVS